MVTALVTAAYVADAAILTTYAVVARSPKRARLFHWANAIGCVPIIGTELVAHAWPALVLTAAFGLIGVGGLL